MNDIQVFLNGILLLDDDWYITNDNDLIISTFVGKDDDVKIRCGDAWVKIKATGLTNRWPIGMDLDQLKFRSFMDSVYRHKDEPLVADLISKLKMTMGLIE